MAKMIRIRINSRAFIPILNMFGPIENIDVDESLADELERRGISITRLVPRVKKKIVVEAPVIEDIPNVTDTVNIEDEVITEPHTHNPDDEIVLLETNVMVDDSGDEVVEIVNDVGDIIETSSEHTGKEDLIDSAIEKILDSASDSDDFNLPTERYVSDKNDEIGKYTEDELGNMTKAQMKAILIERGYIDGTYAPKYHDTLSDLIKKVLDTQE